MCADSDTSDGSTVDAIRTATSLSALRTATAETDDHAAYFAAKRRWRAHWADVEYPPSETAAATGVPGETVVVDGRPVHVHGITHANTDAERSFLRAAVGRWVDGSGPDIAAGDAESAAELDAESAAESDGGAAVYCEQGIRSMYFGDLPAICSADDYRWALAGCRRLDIDSRLGDRSRLEGLSEGLDSLSATFRDAAFSLLDEIVGDRERVAEAVGALAAGLLTSDEDAAVGEDFESFRLTRTAAADPASLPRLQAHYRRTFLPQPIEREWLRRHDPELELMTHARNERLADYALAHAPAGTPLHLIVGAAHQPGVVHYLQRHRDGDRDLTGFELLD